MHGLMVQVVSLLITSITSLTLVHDPISTSDVKVSNVSGVRLEDRSKQPQHPCHAKPTVILYGKNGKQSKNQT